MSSDIRPEDIEAAIAAAEQRRRSRHGADAEAAATAPAGRRSVLPERTAAPEASGVVGDTRARLRPSVNRSSVEDADDSWLDQPVRPSQVGRRYADLPENEVVWEPEPRHRGLALPFGIAVIALLIFGGVLWWVYSSSGEETGSPLPVIVAEDAPIKVKPAEEGGLEVPDQDKLIYDNLAAGAGETAEVEQILPGPEEPIAPPSVTTPGVADPAPLAAIEEEAPAPSTGVVPLSPTPEAAPPATTPGPQAPGAAEQAAPAPSPGAAASTEQAAAAPSATPSQDVPAPSVALAPEPAPAEPAASGSWKIQLAAVKSDEAARREWTRMQKVHPDLLGDMRLTVQRADLGDKGVFFRIQAGPLPDRITAEDVCAELKVAKQACLVVKP